MWRAPEMAAPRLPDVSSRYGAPMGRPDRPTAFDLTDSKGNRFALDFGAPRRFYLRRVPLDGGGYDAGGAYWGIGAPLFWACSDSGVTVERFYRADAELIRKHLDRIGDYYAGQVSGVTIPADKGRAFVQRAAVKEAIRAEFPGATFFR